MFTSEIKKDGKEVQLSFDGSAGDFYSSYFSWSPDSKKLAVNKVRKNEDHFIYFRRGGGGGGVVAKVAVAAYSAKAQLPETRRCAAHQTTIAFQY